MADWQDNEFISGTRFRFFHAPPLPPPIPEPVVELFQVRAQLLWVVGLLLIPSRSTPSSQICFCV
eukprot:3941980-Rhodomonas_salina.9